MSTLGMKNSSVVIMTIIATGISTSRLTVVTVLWQLRYSRIGYWTRYIRFFTLMLFTTLWGIMGNSQAGSLCHSGN